jgi:hypothetical protein
VFSACPMDVGKQNGGRCMAANFMVEDVAEGEDLASSVASIKGGKSAPRKLSGEGKKKGGEARKAGEGKEEGKEEGKAETKQEVKDIEQPKKDAGEGQKKPPAPMRRQSSNAPKKLERKASERPVEKVEEKVDEEKTEEKEEAKPKKKPKKLQVRSSATPAPAEKSS